MLPMPLQLPFTLCEHVMNRQKWSRIPRDKISSHCRTFELGACFTFPTKLLFRRYINGYNDVHNRFRHPLLVLCMCVCMNVCVRNPLTDRALTLGIFNSSFPAPMSCCHIRSECFELPELFWLRVCRRSYDSLLHTAMLQLTLGYVQHSKACQKAYTKLHKTCRVQKHKCSLLLSGALSETFGPHSKRPNGVMLFEVDSKVL